MAAAPTGTTAADATPSHARTASATSSSSSAAAAAAASAADPSAGLRPSHAQAAQAASPASPGAGVGGGGGSHSRQPSSSSSGGAAGGGGGGGGGGHPQLVALRKIDALSEKLQKEGKLLEALQCMEKSLILRGHIFGLDSVEVFRACKSVGEMANFLAMTFLQQGLFHLAPRSTRTAGVCCSLLCVELDGAVRSCIAQDVHLLRGAHAHPNESADARRSATTIHPSVRACVRARVCADLFDVTLELLKKAEVLTERHKAVRAVTFNNMACYYRKRGKLRTALNYARKALGIEAKLAESNAAAAAAGADAAGSVVAIKSADTHLNMCTILSELKRHEKAIVHARIALKLLLLELFGDFDQLQKQEQAERLQQQQQGDGGSGGEQQGSGATRGPAEHEQIATGSNPEVRTDPASMARLRARLPPDRIAVLAIAYHNLAVQQEFLRKYPESLSSYEKATRVVTTHLGASHPLCASLAESYAAAQAKMENKMARQKEHAAARAGGKGMAATSSASSASTAKLDANRSARVDKQHAHQKQPQQQPQDHQQPELYLSPDQEEEDQAYTDDGEYRDEEEAEAAAAAAEAQEEYDRDAEEETALG